MKEYLTILFLALTCESMANILGILGFLVFAMAALILSCHCRKQKKKGGISMSSVYVKNIYTILPKHTLVELYCTDSLSHIFDGMVAQIPPELLFLEVVKFQRQNNKYLLYVR